MTTPGPLASPILTRAEALAGGMTDTQIATRVRQGSWARLARGVYAVGGPVTDPHHRAEAAAAAFGSGLVAVSHHTAARLHGIDVEAAPEEHVTILRGGHRRNRPGIVVHSQQLTADDVTAIQGVPATTVPRTLRDILLLGADRRTAVWACEHAVRRTLTDFEAVARQLAGAARHPHVRRARQRLAMANGLSESPLETGVRLRVMDDGLPEPDVQIPIVDDVGRVLFRIDLGYSRYQLGIECDGKDSHDRPNAIYYDRTRANLLQSRGWRVLRFTWYDLIHRPHYITTTIRRALRELGAPV